MSEITKLAASLPAHEREHVTALAKDVLFMRGKLEETRKALEGQPVVIPYDNGGGQTGIRANPAYTEYEKLLKSYTQAFDALKSSLGKTGSGRKARITTLAGNSKWAANG